MPILVSLIKCFVNAILVVARLLGNNDERFLQVQSAGMIFFFLNTLYPRLVETIEIELLCLALVSGTRTQSVSKLAMLPALNKTMFTQMYWERIPFPMGSGMPVQ